MTYSRRLSTKQSRNALESIWAASRLAAISGPTPFSGMSYTSRECARRTSFRHFFAPTITSASSENARNNTRDVCDIASLQPIGRGFFPRYATKNAHGNGVTIRIGRQGTFFTRPLTDHLDLTNFRQLAARGGLA